MVPFVSRMICRSVRITKCKSRSKVESGVFRCGTPEFFLLPNSSCSLFEDPQNEWQQVINQVEKFFTDKTFFKWYHISKFTFDPFITPHLIISYNFGQTCTTIFLLPRPSHPTIIHNFTWTLDELVQCTMYNFPCFQSLTSNYSSEGFVQITPQLVRFWIISTGLSNVQDYWTLKRLSSLQDKDASWPDRKDPVQSGPCKLACLMLQYDLRCSIF